MSNALTRVTQNILMENAQVVFRNFAGREGQYNREGDRNFCVLLDDDLAENLLADGWNVKRLRPRDGDEVGTAYLQVSVGFKNRPPTIGLITSKGRTNLTEDTVDILDWIDIANTDVVIRPYNWSVNGGSGVKAYVKSLFITAEEDYLQLKYNDVPEIESGGQPLAIEAAPPWDDDDIVDAEIVEEN